MDDTKYTDQTRARNINSDEPPTKKIRPCNFGEICYRRNPSHFEEYSHPHLNKLLATQKDEEDIKLPADFKTTLDSSIIIDQLQILQEMKEQKSTESKVSDLTEQVPVRISTVGALSSSSSNSRTSSISVDSSNSQSDSYMALKKKCQVDTSGECVIRTNNDVAARLAAAAPYHFFLTKVRSSLVTHNEPLSITFRELLHPSLGALRKSLQITFMVEMPWLMHHYEHYGLSEKSLLILYGEQNDDLESKTLPQNIKGVRVRTPHPFGHHHTKMSLFSYEDGSLRVVVSTANLVASDWHNRTQGVWVSPLCPPLHPEADTAAGESPTDFKADLLCYLDFYKLSHLQQWIGIVRRADFSHIRVCFIASVPGTHRQPDLDRWGHRRLAALLKKHACNMDSSWPVLTQCSSIGSLGPEPASWMCGELRASMSHTKDAKVLQGQPAFKVIYPSKRNVDGSLDGPLGGACLPYSVRTHQKQTWFTAFLHEWRSSKRHRSGAVPHIKTYTRLSPNGCQLGWFHLSSANLSKAAWGMNNKSKSNGPGFYIMSYEAGVLFLPQLLVGKPSFDLQVDGQLNSPFPLPYDLPLVHYSPSDKPWIMEYLNNYVNSKKDMAS